MKNALLAIITVLLASCASQSKMNLPEFQSGPDAVIYKMTKDYSEQVPVILSKDKKTILSFPHPKDLRYQGELSTPTKLVKGYWLDNRGINPDVAFTSITYADYVALDRVPDPKMLLEKVIDANPIVEMYNCGPRSDYQTIGELNQLIKSKFKGVEKVK